MSNEILDDLKKSIEKNLPAEVGDVLKKRLAMIPGLEHEVKVFGAEARCFVTDIKELKKERDKLLDLKNFSEALEVRATALDIRDRGLEIALLTKDVACAKGKAASFSEFMLNMSRNTEFRRSFSGEVVAGVSTGFQDQHGYAQPSMAHTAHVDHETTDTVT